MPQVDFAQFQCQRDRAGIDAMVEPEAGWIATFVGPFPHAERASAPS